MGPNENSASASRDFLAASAAYFNHLSDRFFGKAWPSYALVALIQLKVIWFIWRFRDFTTGDTSSYFITAYRWSEDLAANIVWSPLYTSYYGTVLMLTGDAYSATLLHRIVIVMAATLGVLAVMRKLLPPALALLIAMWWAILPINFETLYEVHLFALLPILAAWLVAASGDSPWRRGIALGILFGATLLVRNEMIVATILYALICVVWEWRERRKSGDSGKTNWRTYVASYGIPILVVTALTGVLYLRSDIPSISEAASQKHTLNMCQVYAFGYQQRHPDWKRSPWIECERLMERIFGLPRPTLSQMILANPRAALGHFAWNLLITPNGLQVSLFNAMSGTVNPDYPEVRRSPYALILGLAALLVVAAGGVVGARNWRFWWVEWFRERRGLWLILFAVAAVALPVILTQRPRPSYLFATTVVFMAIIGSAVHVLGYHWLGYQWRRAINAVAAIVGLCLLMFSSPYYVVHRSDRPIYSEYGLLLPFRGEILKKAKKMLIIDYQFELFSYLGLNNKGLELVEYRVSSRLNPADFVGPRLGKVDLIFLQPRIVHKLAQDPEARRLVEDPESLGWETLGSGTKGESRWLLLHRKHSNKTSTPASQP